MITIARRRIVGAVLLFLFAAAFGALFIFLAHLLVTKGGGPKGILYGTIIVCGILVFFSILPVFKPVGLVLYNPDKLEFVVRPFTMNPFSFGRNKISLLEIKNITYKEFPKELLNNNGVKTGAFLGGAVGGAIGSFADASRVSQLAKENKYGLWIQTSHGFIRVANHTAYTKTLAAMQNIIKEYRGEEDAQ